MKTSESIFLRRKRLFWVIPVLAIAVLCIAFLAYTGQYYHAEESAYTALKSDESVTVTQTEYGWLFDGPSETDALIFYPGGKVEETAYAPLLHRLAEQGMDACLVQMSFRLAVFGVNKADRVMERHDYEHWYIGGHSLGGAMAASYAAAHGSKLSVQNYPAFLCLRHIQQSHWMKIPKHGSSTALKMACSIGQGWRTVRGIFQTTVRYM